MQGKANFRGHPLHLMTISLPIGFWSGTVATDLIGRVSADPFWFRMSVALIAMGGLTGAIASVFGLVDYYTAPMSAPAKRIATLHLAGSLVTLALFAIAYGLRRDDHASAIGVAMTLAGALALFVAGFWGSDLALRFGVGLPQVTSEPAVATVADRDSSRGRNSNERRQP